MNLFPDTLKKAQGDFSKALTDPNSLPPIDLAQSETAIAKQQSKRFDVYRNNVISTLVDALGDSFPTVRKLVGDDYFVALARAYADHELPNSPLLFRYGKSFGDFLASFPPVQKSVPYIADMARLEFARLQAYHAEDEQPIEIVALSALVPEQMDSVRLLPHSSLAVLASNYPIVSLFGATNGQLPDSAVDMKQAETALVTRPGLAVNTVLLSRAGQLFLEALVDGKSLAQATAAVSGQHEEFDLATHLAALFDAGAFKGIWN